MALVAYSDESDFSEGEETIDRSTDLQKEHIQDKEEINIDKPSSQLLSAIPNPQKPVGYERQLNISEDSDIVDDVPTVRTWNITKNLTETEKISSNDDKKKNGQRTAINKIKIILPALSEFADEEEDESIEENQKKKIRPSPGGTGLFSVLPKPRNSSLLVPQSVKKRPSTVQSKTKKKEVLITTPECNVDSDEEDILKSTNTSDFFSLTDTPSELPTPPNNTPCLFPSNVNPQLSPSLQTSYITTEQQLPSVSDQKQGDDASPPLFIPFSHPEEPSTGHGIEEEALRRLAGGRNKGEIPTIIDIKADDALMSREEWVTRALCDEKPKKSFSTKKEGNPTQQQKRKHQITYLAHQAQERENDLQNNWGQNRFTKIQTRSKYGF